MGGKVIEMKETVTYKVSVEKLKETYPENWDSRDIEILANWAVQDGIAVAVREDLEMVNYSKED